MILQKSLPYDPWAEPGLPGVSPLSDEDWLIFDDAFAGQMAERDRLIETRRDAVIALAPEAADAAEELLDLVLTLAYPLAGTDVVDRRDGVRVPILRDDPMGTLGRLVQEDLCLLQTTGAEHVLSGAVLCFPASWMLSEKFNRPLTGIHEPVASYDAGIARRVQRLFDGVRVGHPLWRFNALWYADPSLHQPRSLNDRRTRVPADQAGFLRSERQCILRLPRSRAVVFSIHTYVLARADAPAGAGGETDGSM